MVTGGKDSIALKEEQPGMVVIDEANYQEWSSKDVLIWVKINLENNGIEERKIKTFLKHFSQKNISGQMLKYFKDDPNIINALIAQSYSSNEKDSFAIWLALSTVIKNLNSLQEYHE